MFMSENDVYDLAISQQISFQTHILAKSDLTSNTFDLRIVSADVYQFNIRRWKLLWWVVYVVRPWLDEAVEKKQCPTKS